MAELKRELSLFDLTMIAIGGTIGSGIFLTPSLIAQELSFPVLILAVWLLGGVLALSGALTFAELGGMIPEAGGVYRFLAESYGGLAGFLYGWAYFLVVNTGGLGALSLAFATYLGYLIPLSPSGVTAVAIGGLILVTVINVLGVRAGGVFSDIFTILKLAGIGGLLVLGFGWGHFGHVDLGLAWPDTGRSLSGAISVALIGVLWSYGGWQHATYTAAEAKDPATMVPRALVLGAGVVVVVYVAINIAYLMLLPVETIASSKHVAADAAERVLGPVGGSLIALTIFISTFGTAGIYTLTAPRIYFAMARDGVFFKSVAAVHPRYHTPARAILVQTLWGIVLILFWGTFEDLISYVVFTDWIFFGLAGAGVIVLRRKRPEAHRPYRTVGYPFTPLLFTGVAAWFVVSTMIEKPLSSAIGLVFLALGVPVYYYWKRKTR
jgi:basic amino acid/polyamine antiporter, APA family